MKTYNEWIKMYMKTDRNPLIPKVVDKYQMKKYAKFKNVLTPRNIKAEDTDSFVMKCNNDSGGTWIVRHNRTVSGSRERLNRHKTIPYGVNKGEWFYGPIKHKIFTEEYLADNIIDYKFHCHKGKVMFCQIIGDRNTKTSECLYLEDGTLLDYRLDEKFAYKKYLLPNNWEEMKKSAIRLSEPFNYVRVDLFNVNNKIYVGELTFAPRGGNYTGKGQIKLGAYF